MSAIVRSERWAEVLATFDEVIELEATARGQRLAAIGANDPDLRRAVEALLAADAQADTRLARLDAVLAGDAGLDTRRPESDPLQLVGRTVSHFRVIESHAQGGMGIVYRAEDTRLGRQVALKFPLAAHHLDRRAKERFLHEARLAGALDHPNLCAIYEAGETDDGRLFHAMPLYAGETLKARLLREGALPIAGAVAIAKQIALGLGAAHKAGIVHRDLKPANIMLPADDAVKIVDFGLARTKEVDLTSSQTALGTVSYMAPEQIYGRPVDARADLWALGVVLYEMLTGTRPFEGEHAVSVIHAIVHTDPVRPSALRREISPDLEGVVHRLLSKDPTARYQSAEDVTTALAAIAPDRGGAPGPLARLDATARRRSHRWPRPVALTAISIAALSVAGWLVSRRLTSTPEPRSIAILPFADSSDSKDNAHIAIGLSQAVRTEVSRLRAVTMPSPITAASHREASKTPSQTARALGVSAVITGTVRRAGDRVHLTVRLADAGSGTQRWERRYERELSNLAGLERAATRGIVEALRVDVTRRERAMLDRRVTSDGRAYEAYLRGQAAELAGPPRRAGDFMPTDNVREAQSLYARARDLDPGFALARARLATMLMYGAATYDTTRARREQARLEAEAALRLQSDLSEAHGALAGYWFSAGENELAKALDELNLAIAGAPNSVELHLRLAHLYRRTGRWEDAVSAIEHAMRLDPRNPGPATQAAFTYLRLRRDEAAMRAFDRAIELAPADHMLRVIKGHTYLRWRGTPDTLAAVLRAVPANWDPDGMTTWARYTVLRVQRRHAETLAMLDASRSALSRDGLVYQPTALMRAQTYEALGDRSKARAHYELARRMLTDSVAAQPRDASIRISLALVYAALGRKSEAMSEARHAMALVPLSQNSPAATALMGTAIEVFGRVGDLDAAFETLELLLAMPAGREVTVPFLRVWPGFDPLRNDPRFDRLIARFAVS